MKSAFKNQRGLSVVEALVSVTILSVTAMTLTKSVVTSFAQSERELRSHILYQILTNKIEQTSAINGWYYDVADYIGMEQESEETVGTRQYDVVWSPEIFDASSDPYPRTVIRVTAREAGSTTHVMTRDTFTIPWVGQ
ncbi:hypothetical protein JNK13_02320 [bacterium]|nr:hypothetical protein [bacterium]